MSASEEFTAFHGFLMETYWPSLPPEERHDAPPEELGDVPSDIWRAAWIVFPNVGAWLDNPIPDAGGRSARQLLAAGDRARVEAILMEVAPVMLPHPSEMKPWTR